MSTIGISLERYRDVVAAAPSALTLLVDDLRRAWRGEHMPGELEQSQSQGLLAKMGSPVDDDEWFTLRQAAYELRISTSGVRRMLRRGLLRNRVVPRPGGFAYLIHIPNPAAEASPPDESHAAKSTLGSTAPRPSETNVGVATMPLRPQATPRHWRIEVGGPDNPYAHYRRLVRKRRWWQF